MTDAGGQSQEMILAELTRLEQLMHQPPFRRDRTAVAALLAEEFREYGSSGRIYDKAAILDLLAAESDASQISSSHFELSLPGPAAALLTYRSTRSNATSLRSSLWVHRAGRWQLLFHQGTRIATK